MMYCKTMPELLTSEPWWLAADEKKIPVLPESDIHIKGERIVHCQHWQQVRPLIEKSIHPYAVYLHNQQEPFIALDLDHARNTDTGQPEPWVIPLFRAIGIQLDTVSGEDAPYIELSSSGSGYHVLFTGITDFGKRSWFSTDDRGKGCPKIEIIAYNNPITWTGNCLPCSGQKALPVGTLLDYLKATYPRQHHDDQVLQTGSTRTLPPFRFTDRNTLTAEQIRDMLGFLDPDCDHDQWKQIGMSIHDWDSSASGMDIWMWWSQGGKKFDSEAPGSLRSAWKGFHKGKGIGVGTLVKLAMDSGYRFPKETVNLAPSTQKVQLPAMQTEKKTGPEIVPISPEVDVQRQIQDNITRQVKLYNQRFIHSRINTRNRVLQLEMDDEHNQMNWSAMSLADFREMMLHEPPIPIRQEEDSKGRMKLKTQSAAQVWLSHSQANFIPASTFYPWLDASSPWPPMYKGKLNLYRGFAVEPQPCNQDDPDIQTWLYHIRTVVCQDDDKVFSYMMDWFAHMIQKPHEKPQTAIILKGGQGTGKNCALRPLLDIMGVHGLYVERPGAVSGKHNKVLDNVILVFADEAAFTNSSDCRILRALVTERSGIMEPKGIDAYSQRNFIRLIMATNSDSAIRFASDERRYLVVEMSDQYQQDYDYFAALSKASSNGLAGKLLFLLQHRDIRQFLPMKIPKTRYLTEAKINNLEPQQAFIYESLMNGSFQANGGWPARMDTQAVQHWFQEWLDKKHLRFIGDIGKKLGRVINQIGGDRSRLRIGSDLGYQYQFEDLMTSRKNFEKNVMAGSEIGWDSKQ